MKKALIVHFAPGDNSYTDKSVEIITKRLEDSYDVQLWDLLEQVPENFNRKSLNAYVKRNLRKEEISESDADALRQLDLHFDQIVGIDLLVVAYPMYNFNIPATVKAWIDSITQRDKAFGFGPVGPEGKLGIKNALLVMSTGGAKIESSRDFATPYMKYVMNYIGIEHTEAIGMTRTNMVEDNQLEKDFTIELEKYLLSI